MDEEILELDVLEGIFDGSLKPTDLKLSALQSITENFSEERIIGTGGFGTIYKGVLQNGEVAVKRIKNNHTIDEKVFRREVTSLLNVSHENIVRFLGFCSHTEHKAFKNEGSRDYIYAENRERILCFEYVKNGSLKKYIADELRGLQWDTRYSIIKGICMGLQYLHVETGIIHMDLKPANILIDDNMIAKITDFGLSRLEQNAQTQSTARASSPGYTAPEYIDNGVMSVKYDVYSLGVIIIELVTGSRSIPDSNNVIRRWSHRWHNSGKETPFRYEQIAKLIEIGLLCQEKDPFKRPFISQIMHVINELECTGSQISNANESTVGQISPYLEDDMLGIEPLELRFPFELNKQISCFLKLTNKTNAFIAFNIQPTSSLLFCIQPDKGIVAPRSKCTVNITLQPLAKAPQDKYNGNFIVRSTKVNNNRKSEDITEDIFNKKEGKLVDEVNLTVTYKVDLPQVDLSPGSVIILDTGNLHCPQEFNVPPTEAESKISASCSDEVIQFDPPKLFFPFVPNKKVFSSFKITNVTESYVSFCLVESPGTEIYGFEINESILPPRSTECQNVTREGTEDAVEDIQFEVWYAIVDEDIKACDLEAGDYYEYKKLHIVLTKVDSCTSNELIQFDPPELSFPCQNKISFSSVYIVNNTDCYIGFNTWQYEEIDAEYEREPSEGILPPRSTQRMVVQRIPKEKKVEDMQFKNNLFVWNMIVSEGVEASSLEDYYSDEDSKEIPLSFQKISPCSSDELIRLDYPGVRFIFSQNKMALSSFNMVNVTEYCIGFRLFDTDIKGLSFMVEPAYGILAPRSAQRVVVAMQNEPKDMQYNGESIIWNAIVSEGIKASDLSSRLFRGKGEELKWPIVLNDVTSSISVELTKFEPPEVCFPFLPSKRMASSFKIVNITEYHIGFNTCVDETNVGLYITEPACGILPPRSTEELVVTRVAKEEAPELEDMQCKDKYWVWSCFVTEDVKASDLEERMPINERKELPIVFTGTSSNELIQFDPPELCLPLLPNQRVLSSAKMVNITEQYIGFRICSKKSNSAWYDANPSEGVLPPLFAQTLLITRIGEEQEVEVTQCKDKFLVWNGIVTEDVKASSVIDNMSETKCTELPIILTKASSYTSHELIQFDPPELHFPHLSNKKVSTSIKMVNLTDYNVGFNTYSRPTNAAWYHTEPPRGILPPQSTQKLIVTREEKEDVLEDKQFDDKYFVWKSVVSEFVKAGDLSDCIDDKESKELPVVLDKISSSISDELIQFDPAELCIPALLNKDMLLGVNVVNTTDFYVAFHACYIERDAARKIISKKKGILPPRSSEKLTFNWRTTEQEFKDMEPNGDYVVWNRVVTECVKSQDIVEYMDEEESKKLPLILNKASPCTSNELIQFDPPKLNLLLSNNPLVFSFNIANITEFCVSFRILFPKRNVGMYNVRPASGVMEPRSTQRIVVKTTPKKKEQEDVQYEDALSIYSCLVMEGVDRVYYEVGKKFPIVYKKTGLCTSDELIQLDPPQLTFPFLPNKRVSMLRKFKIVNVTDYIVGFRIGDLKSNHACYIMEPSAGILSPQSTQEIKIRRTPGENETENMECKDKIIVWNGIVSEGIQASDVSEYIGDDDKELPVVLTKPGERS